MEKRFVSIWFPFLKTEWLLRRQKDLHHLPLVFYVKDRGRMVVSAVNKEAMREGIQPGLVLADAKAITKNLQSFEEPENVFDEVLLHIAEWFIRFSPVIAVQSPDGLIIDATGCAHLWGSEEMYLRDIRDRLLQIGYTIRLCMAGTIGAAAAICRYGDQDIVPMGQEQSNLQMLPPVSLRIEEALAEKLNKLGLRTIKDITAIPPNSLRRRFGVLLLQRLRQSLGEEEEIIEPIRLIAPYTERLSCLEPILTRTGIEMALNELLDKICKRLAGEQKGIRVINFSIYTIDGKQQCITVETSRATATPGYLFKLFELKLSTVAPGFGIELFVLDVIHVEDLLPEQENIWLQKEGLSDRSIAAFVDKLSNKIGQHKIARYVPARHYWPERSFEKAASLTEKPFISWSVNRSRPIKLLNPPQPIQVTAPIPDYPPMNFRHNNLLHKIVKADGPERMEQEWWIQDGVHRDYYYVEDEEGKRYWLFRLGHYDNASSVQWYLHGYCA